MEFINRDLTGAEANPYICDACGEPNDDQRPEAPSVCSRCRARWAEAEQSK
jgi:predicted Zn-ribbon and HTH transcriptional regulator